MSRFYESIREKFSYLIIIIIQSKIRGDVRGAGFIFKSIKLPINMSLGFRDFREPVPKSKPATPTGIKTPGRRARTRNTEGSLPSE